MARRQSLFVAGSGCLLAAPSALMVVGGLGAAVEGTAPLRNMMVTVLCFGTLTALGLVWVALGLRRLPERRFVVPALRRAVAGSNRLNEALARSEALPAVPWTGGRPVGTSEAPATDAPLLRVQETPVNTGAVTATRVTASRGDTGSADGGVEPEGWLTAQTLYAAGHYNKALVAFQSVGMANPDRYGECMMWQGRCLRALTRNSEALQHYAIARAYGVDAALVAQLIAEIDARQ